MLPVLFEISLDATSGTVVLYILSIVIPCLFAWRARKDAELGFVEKNRWIKVLVGGTIAAIAVVTFFVRPFQWTQPLEIPLHTYGFMIAMGFVAGIVVGLREARRLGLDLALVMDIAFWALLFGLIGSRVLFIMVNTDQYFGANFMSSVDLAGLSFRIPTVLVFWRGGLVFFGGFIGAGLAIFFFIRKHKLNGWRYADALFPSLPLGHFFGRLGCFAAGCCFGKPCAEDSSVCAHFPSGSLAYSQSQVDTHIEIGGAWYTAGLYPTQLFEAGGLLLIFIILILLRPYKRFDGQIMVTYLVLYPLLRSMVEVFRGDFGRGMILRIPHENPVLLSTSQLISVIVALVGIALIVYRIRQLRLKEGSRQKDGGGMPLAANN